MDEDRSGRWIVGLAAGIVYLNSLANGFVFDDLIAVVQNPLVHQPRFLFHAFTTDYWRGTSVDLLYRPLTVFSWGINNLLHGMRPFGFHLANVVLHVLVSLTVFRLVNQLFQNLRLALVTGVVFALHPIHTEAVASIVGRAELLMSLFALLALHFYLQATESSIAGGRSRFLLCMLCYLMACLSKENGIATPAFLFLAEVALCLSAGNWNRFRGPNVRRSLFCYGSLAAIALLYLLLRFLVLGNLTLAYAAEQKFTVRGTLVGFPWPLQFANALQYFARYLWLLVFPLRLSSDYSFDQIPAHEIIWHTDIGLGALALLLLGLAALFSARRAPPVFFGVTAFLLTFLPTSNFIIPILTTLAERTMYLPSFGFLLVMAWVLCAVVRVLEASRAAASARRWTVPMAYVFFGVLLGFYAVRTGLRNRDWHDEIALFSSAVRVCPKCGNCYNCLGEALARAGRYEEAMVAFKRSLDIIPDHGAFYLRMAKALLQSGNDEAAIQAYKMAVEYEPALAEACDQLGRIYTSRGKLDEALYWSMKAVAIQPEAALYHYNLGYIFQKQDKLREAARQYDEAATLNPQEPSYAFNLGTAYRDLGELDKALSCFQRATQLNPHNEKYWMTLSDSLLKKGALYPAAEALEELVKCSTNAAVIAEAKQIIDRIRKGAP